MDATFAEELAKSIDLNPIQYLWDELEQDCNPGLLFKYECLTS